MVAIRNRNTNVPHVFRYPKWEQGIFYPAGSLVSYPASGLIDSELSYWNFYTSLRDVQPTESAPDNNANWAIFYDSTAQGLDSDLVDRVLALEATHDSDIARIVHNYLANDSDIQEYLTRDHDSDIRVAVHDYLAGDSDLSERIIGGVWDYGSF